jgi:hypothetical protein
MRLTLLVCAALVSVLVRASAFAQDPTGAIEGAVADKTGSVIPAARVTAKNLAQPDRRPQQRSPYSR